MNPEPEELEETDEPEPIEEYVPGIANGRHYMARLCHLPDGPWYIDVVHVESLPPLHGSDETWLTREEAVQAAGKLVADRKAIPASLHRCQHAPFH